MSSAANKDFVYLRGCNFTPHRGGSITIFCMQSLTGPVSAKDCRGGAADHKDPVYLKSYNITRVVYGV